jgi:hypothetical protein
MAANMLEKTGGENAVEGLKAVLLDPDSVVRGAAADALVSIGGERAAAALLGALDDKNLPALAGAYEYYIRLGRADSEDVLIGALDEYGGRGMAEAFLNCGNAKLEKAGSTWAYSHGYRVTEDKGPFGRAPVPWGSGTGGTGS